MVVLAVAGLRYLDDYLTLRHQRESRLVLSSASGRAAGPARSLPASAARAASRDRWLARCAREDLGALRARRRARRSAGQESAAGRPRAPLDARRRGREDVKDELALLAGRVKEEGDNLRSLERFLSRAGKLLASLPSRWPVRGPAQLRIWPAPVAVGANAEFHSGIDIGAADRHRGQGARPGHGGVRGAPPGVRHHPHHRPRQRHQVALRPPVAAQRRRRPEDRARAGARLDRQHRPLSGPHLHYEIQVKGQPVNPTSYLWE